MTRWVSLDRAKERRRAYFYRCFGKHWVAITGRKDGSNYSLFYSLSPSVSASLSFFPSQSTILLFVFSSTPLINKLECSPFKIAHGIFLSIEQKGHF